MIAFEHIVGAVELPCIEKEILQPCPPSLPITQTSRNEPRQNGHAPNDEAVQVHTWVWGHIVVGFQCKVNLKSVFRPNFLVQKADIASFINKDLIVKFLGSKETQPCPSSQASPVWCRPLGITVVETDRSYVPPPRLYADPIVVDDVYPLANARGKSTIDVRDDTYARFGRPSPRHTSPNRYTSPGRGFVSRIVDDDAAVVNYEDRIEVEVCLFSVCL